MLDNKLNDYSGINNVDITYSKTYTHLEESEVIALYNFIKNTKGDVLELGRLYGGSTNIILKAMSSNCVLYSVDRVYHPLKAFKEEEYKLLEKCRLITADSTKVKLNKNFETVFIDTTPSYQSVLKNIKNVWNHVDNYFIFHDYKEKVYEADGMKKIVDYLVKSRYLKIISITNTLIITQKLHEKSLF